MRKRPVFFLPFAALFVLTACSDKPGVVVVNSNSSINSQNSAQLSATAPNATRPNNVSAPQSGAPAGPRMINKVAAAGTTTTLEGILSLNPDCSAKPVTIKISQAPVHGTAAVTSHDQFPSYPPTNPRSACNQTKRPNTAVDYTPANGFTGSDFMVIQAFFPDTGNETDEKIAIDVK